MLSPSSLGILGCTILAADLHRCQAERVQRTANPLLHHRAHVLAPEKLAKAARVALGPDGDLAKLVGGKLWAWRQHDDLLFVSS